MFKMTEINPSYYKFLKILWKDNKSSNVLPLLILTYGSEGAPHLATKTLRNNSLSKRKGTFHWLQKLCYKISIWITVSLVCQTYMNLRFFRPN